MVILEPGSGTLSPEGRGNRPIQSQDHRHTQHEVTSAAAPGFHAALAKQRGVLRRYCESLEGLRDVLLLRNGHDTEREQHVVLQLARQWADVVGAGYRQQDIDLLDTELDFAIGDRLGNRASVDELCAGLEFSRDAEFLHHLGGDVAGAAVRIADRLGIEHRALERFDAPAFTETPTPALPKSTCVPATTLPLAMRSSMACGPAVSTSAGALELITPAKSAVGTKRTTTLCPLARSNAGARSLIPDTLPIPASIVISAACREHMPQAVSRLKLSIQVRNLITTSLCFACADLVDRRMYFYEPRV